MSMDNIIFVHKKPMFYFVVRYFFPSADWDKGVIITYAPYVFSKHDLPESLIAHELTHVNQQKHPLLWWIRYIFSPKFRFKEELEAHCNEYKSIVGTDRNKQFYLDAIADRLSGALYNNLVSKEEAKRLILKAI
jgi:hypothetical protein